MSLIVTVNNYISLKLSSLKQLQTGLIRKMHSFLTTDPVLMDLTSPLEVNTG